MEQQIFVENLQVHLKKQLRSKMRVLSGVIPFSMIIQENFPRSTMFGKDIRDLYNYEVNISKESLPYFTKNRRKKYEGRSLDVGEISEAIYVLRTIILSFTSYFQEVVKRSDSISLIIAIFFFIACKLWISWKRLWYRKFDHACIFKWIKWSSWASLRRILLEISTHYNFWFSERCKWFNM